MAAKDDLLAFVQRLDEEDTIGRLVRRMVRYLIGLLLFILGGWMLYQVYFTTSHDDKALVYAACILFMLAGAVLLMPWPRRYS